MQPYKKKSLTYLDTLKFRERLQKSLKEITQEKGEKIGTYSESEQVLAYLAFSTTQMQIKGSRNGLFQVIPSDDKTWHAPWQVLSTASGPAHKRLFDHWKTLAQAYHAMDPQLWEKTTKEILAQTINSDRKDIRPVALETEHLYNQTRPLIISFWLYMLSLMCVTGVLFSKKEKLMTVAAGFLSAGIVVHFLAIAARIFILERPPVSTLYESVVFVGLIVAAYGLISWLRNRQAYSLLAAGLGSVLLHQLGFAHEGQSDSFMMLSAVLNTNFWLATHVICITAGYAFCLITSLIAHVLLIRQAGSAEKQTELFKSMHTMALVALLFSATGTVLGGIWADYSWGRFWGWDPKENGALLIVLWLVWILHGRISGQMNQLWVSTGLAYLSVIVALSWFGVNLLSVGLHSYGFTDSASWILGGFITAQTAALAILITMTKTRGGRHAA